MIEGRHYQNAYVTRNTEKAVAALAEQADARSVRHALYTTEVTTPQGSGPQTVKLGFVWVGDLQYEFVEPITEATPVYTPYLPEGDLPRFHHTCARVDDWDDFRKRVDQGPFPLVMEGASGDDLKFLYLDARDLLGHYLEYTWMTDARWAQIGGR